MRYLLVDFGASFVKTTIYDSSSDTHSEEKSEVSPFQSRSFIGKDELMSFMNQIVAASSPVDGIVVCSILGGGWVNDVYHSWKSSSDLPRKHCLISGLFETSPLYHLHRHHGGSVDGLLPIGNLNGVDVYSPLGDTNCVIESLNLQDNEYAINMGTGSQIIFMDSNRIEIISFFPAGRAFLVFETFLASLGMDFFAELEKLTVQQVVQSDLVVNLNVFPQAKHFKDGGGIFGILEGKFTLQNVLCSILRCFVLQYAPYLKHQEKDKIRLVGGIPSRLPIIKELFDHYYPNKTITMNLSTLPSTHEGMTALIKRYLP